MHVDFDAQTFVEAAVNGRDQAFLTPESVSDISRTIKLQQFFPAIGREVDGRIEVLDGSRRRAACLYNGTPFEVLVTKNELSLSDARQLAIDIQTAKEHTLRELGKRLMVMYPESMNQSEIARAEGLSAAKISRAFQAASVPDELIGLFPSVSDLSINDYQTLLDIAEKVEARKGSLDELVETVRERIEGDTTLDPHDPTSKSRIIGFIRSVNSSAKSAKADKKVVTEKMAEFADKKQFARKKTDAEKRLVTYEFSRIPAHYQAELDAAVKTILEKMQAESKA